VHPGAAPTCNGDAQVPAEGRVPIKIAPCYALSAKLWSAGDPHGMHPLRNKDGGFSPTRPGLHHGGIAHGAQEEDGPVTWEAFIYPLVFFFRASQRQPTGYRWERNKSRRSCGRSRR
jgi:hypothetical protein